MPGDQSPKGPEIPKGVDPSDLEAKGEQVTAYYSQPEENLGVSPQETTSVKRALEQRQKLDTTPDEQV
ncbi:MAG: hypothetical protein AAB971_00275 [Patescibacteria group bacterium]